MKRPLPIVLLTVLILISTQSVPSDVEFTSAELGLIQAFGPWPPPIPADPGNELSGQSWAEALGELLFNDPALSANGSVSCAHCHQAARGFSDGKSLAQGLQRHHRNTQGLLDTGLQRWFGWDGGADSLWSAAIRPLLSEIEMGNSIPQLAAQLRKTHYFTETLKQQTGSTQQVQDDEQLVVTAAKAIAAYNRTLVSARTPFDRFRDNLANGVTPDQTDYPLAAQRGLKLFLGESNCFVCHFGPDFTNGEFHDTGRPFFIGVGQVDNGRYQGIKRVRTDPFNLMGEYASSPSPDAVRKVNTVTLGQVNFGQWRTPSLRNLTLTAPYTHDGSLPTLRDVVDAYADIDPDRLHADGEALLKPLMLSEQERRDLVIFLESLTAP